MVKKLLSVLMAVVLVFMSFTAVIFTANAAETNQTVTVTAESNLFPPATQTFTQAELAASGNLITVTYFIRSEEQMVNCSWWFVYPDAGVEVRESDNQYVMPAAADATVNFDPTRLRNSVLGNCSNLNAYYLNTESGSRIGFVSVTFRPDGTTDDIYVRLDVEDLKFTRVEPGQVSSPENETKIIDAYEFMDNDLVYDVSTSVYAGQYDEGYQDPEPTEVPTEPYVPTRIFGDVNNDGKISIPDATYIQRHISEFVNPDGLPLIDETDRVEKSVADVNFDGIISIKDITLIQRHVAEMRNSDGTPLIDETILF